MVLFPSRWLVTSGSVSTTKHIQYQPQKLHSKSLCCSLTTAFTESVWETESNFLLTLTMRHMSEDCATAGQQHDCCNYVPFKYITGITAFFNAWQNLLPKYSILKRTRVWKKVTFGEKRNGIEILRKKGGYMACIVLARFKLWLK